MPITSEMFQRVLSATTVRDVIQCIQAVSEVERVAWLPVGGNENNLATINLGSDPAAGVIERVTNAVDAVLEREWIERGEPTGVRSPRGAVEQWFGIREGRLHSVEDLKDPEIVDLSGKVRVTLRDSELNDRPTLDIRDFGVGIPARSFSSSILSLHGTRKLQKLFLAGAFGQGGSTALSYSQFTIIVSKSIPRESEDSKTAFTIVRFNQGDPDVDKHGVYEYLVSHRTGHPLTFSPGHAPFPSGTLVRHISMDLGKYKSIMTAPTGSLWYLTQHYLFDPVLPFRIEEERGNSSQGQTRTVAGNHRLLSTSRIKEYDRSAELTFRAGTVRIKWWVLSAEGDTARDRIKQYTLPSKPIVITYNGQKQGELPNTIIKKDLKLPYLERYLIVHVDCDRLDNESRRQLFPTTRESLRESALLDDLRRLVVDTLDGDGELRRLDRERRERYMHRAESESVENIRRRLAKRVKATVSVGGSGRSPRVRPPQSNPDPPPTPIPVQDPPTFLEVIQSSPRGVYAGRRFAVRFQTDADPAYFLNPDSFVAVIDPPTFGEYSGTTSVRDGHGNAYFKASEDLDVGEEAKLTLELRPRRTASLRASLDVVVRALPEEGGTGRGATPTPNINPEWITRGDDFWIDENWDDRSVAKVVQSEDSIEVFVSAENTLLNRLITRAQRRSTEAVDAVKDFYLEHISFYAVLAELTNEAEEEGEGAIERLEAFKAREIGRACEMLCGVMEDTFEVVTERAAHLEEVEV